MTATPPPLPATMTVAYAGAWRRMAAINLDLLLFTVPVVAYLWTGHDLWPLLTSARFWAGSAVLGWGYFTWPTHRYGGTPGKLLVGLRVQDEQTGALLSYGGAVARYLGYYLSALTLGMGFLMQPFTQKQQALHDKIARCVVMDVRRRPAWHIWLINLAYCVASMGVDAVLEVRLLDSFT